MNFKNESKYIAVLSHPNIVKVYDMSFGDRLQYIVMEFIEGITLKEYIEQQKVIQPKEAVHFVTQILRALQHAHDKGIVHRDVKPQNIMLLQNGSIKVTDFGIASFSRSETATIAESWAAREYLISRISVTDKHVCFRNTAISSLAEWIADVSANPITVRYILATPIETPLTAEQLLAYAALHTNYPITTIMNDSGAGMYLGYVADLDNYIVLPSLHDDQGILGALKLAMDAE